MDEQDSRAVLRLVGLYGRLRSQLASELGRPPLVLPNSQYFPDRFDGSLNATQRLVERMQTHAGIGDIPVRVVTGPELNQAKNCSSGACGPSLSANTSEPRLIAQEQGWLLRLEAQEVTHPVALTTIVAQALGLVFLEETRADGQSLPEPVLLHQELSAVLLGFGVLLLEGSHVYSKSCGGPQIARLTALDTAELALAVTLFCSDHNTSMKPALRSTSPTQHAALDEASALLRGNPRLLQWVRAASTSDPEPTLALAAPKRPLFGGLFERVRPRAPDDQEDLETVLERELSLSNRRLSETGPKPSVARPAVDDEVKTLVAEVLRE